MAVLIPATVRKSENSMSAPRRGVNSGVDFERILAHAFRRAGWRIQPAKRIAGMEADLVIDRDGRKYVVQLKTASEGRRDRMTPLLAQAILQAQAFARRLPEPAAPLAVVAARRVPASVAERLIHFAQLNAPDIAVGVIDGEGFRSFAGPGLEGLDANPPRRAAHNVAQQQPLPDLFSDLNQWLLKVLLGRKLPEQFIAVPRESIRNASQLARAANVSVMSASRFVHRLAREGFLDQRRDSLQVVRTEELLARWITANRGVSRHVPARWIIKGGEKQFFESVVALAVGRQAEFLPKSRLRSGRIKKAQPRLCVGHFAAADALGFGFVRGVPPQLCLESLDLDVLHEMGLSIEDADRLADVGIRVPSNKEAIFRASVVRGGLPVCDLLQVWLDASAHPARGREQSDQIRRVLKPVFGNRQ